MENYDYYLVTRPLFSKFDRENGIPTIRKISFNANILKDIQLLNFSNINQATKNSLISTFHHDNKLNCLWNNPLKYTKKFKETFAVITPDYTIQSNMDDVLIASNIYKNRWLGCTWQQYGINVIPSVSWANENTYDICFSGIEEQSVIAVSTIGCLGSNEKEIFLKGYKELLKRKKASLIFVYGKIIEGMDGPIHLFNYTDAFNKKKFTSAGETLENSNAFLKEAK